MRKPGLFLLGLGLVFSLFSCQPKTTANVTLTLDYALASNNTFVDRLSQAFPEVTFEVTWYRGRNPSSYILQKLEQGDESDLVLSPSLPSVSLQEARLMDLSSYDYPNRYDATTWKDYTHNGHVYLLPGPVQTTFLAYNQSLFEKHAWSLPKNLDELVTLAKTIRKDAPDVTPIFFAGASLAGESFFEDLLQNDAVFTPKGSAWIEPYREGTQSVSQGIGKTVSVLASLSAASAFSGADRNRWRAEAYTRFVNQRQSAFLYVYNGLSDLDSLVQKSTDTFNAIAIPGFHANNNLLGIESVVNVGLSKRLNDKGNEAKKAKALAVIDYLSTAAGMEALAGKEPCYYPLLGVSNTNLSSFYKKVYALSDTAVQARSLQGLFDDVSAELPERLRDILFNKGDTATLSPDIDSWHQQALAGKATAFYGEFAKDFTAEETAQFQANIIKQSSVNPDLALVTLGQRKDGIINELGASWGKLYQGTLKSDEVNITVCKDGSILTLGIPGKYLVLLLNKGRKMVNTEKDVAYFPFYYSGMEAVTANGAITELKKDGVPLVAEQTYQVAS
jgi:hypothetical protein